MQGSPGFGRLTALLLLGIVTTMPRRRALQTAKTWASQGHITYKRLEIYVSENGL